MYENDNIAIKLLHQHSDSIAAMCVKWNTSSQKRAVMIQQIKKKHYPHLNIDVEQSTSVIPPDQCG
jgi:hypothetical protein